MSSDKRVFRCLGCGREFKVPGNETVEKCLFCRSRFLTLVEGEPLPRQAGCAPSG